MKTPAGPEGRIALYALAVTAGDALIALEVAREDVFLEAVLAGLDAISAHPQAGPLVHRNTGATS